MYLLLFCSYFLGVVVVVFSFVFGESFLILFVVVVVVYCIRSVRLV